MDFENLNSPNPIDYIEDIIHSKKWSFSRATDDELVADISSQWCQYRLYFSWSEQIRAIKSELRSGAYDLSVRLRRFCQQNFYFEGS